MQTSAQMMDKAKLWLTNDVFPLWSTTGVFPDGSFVEALNYEKQPFHGPQRAIVQSRQLYSFAEGIRLGVIPETKAKNILSKATDFFIENYTLPSGAFCHAVEKGAKNLQTDLYSQAFVIFALAQSHEFHQKPEYKNKALGVLKYLQKERRNPAGGYTEIKSEVLYQSNPHMHLFEAALAWVKIDKDPIWRELADELFSLCQTKFVQPSGLLAEHFSKDWNPQLTDGNFVIEPGHHYEWAWLVLQYKELTGVNTSVLAATLFDAGEKYGIHPETGFVIDEVWSLGKAKKQSSRFWPQCERIKAAVALGQCTRNPMYGPIADRGMELLFKYFEVAPGIWEDTFENGAFTKQPIRASSLYHIINAISEYCGKRIL